MHDTSLAEPTIPTELLRIKNTDISAHLKLPPATWTGEMEHVPQKSSRFGRYDISLSKRAWYSGFIRFNLFVFWGKHHHFLKAAMAILNQDLPRTAFGSCGFRLTVLSFLWANKTCVVLPAYLRNISTLFDTCWWMYCISTCVHIYI